MREVPMKVDAVLADPNTDAQVIILKHDQARALLPIWVDSAEAYAIRITLEKIVSPRPLTHDLLKNLLTVLHILLKKSVITDVNNNVYSATLYLEKSFGPESILAEGEIIPPARFPETAGHDKPAFPTIIEMDARPSDAIALSLRTGAPIYVTQDVLNKKDPDDGFSEWLSRLRPTHFISPPNE